MSHETNALEVLTARLSLSRCRAESTGEGQATGSAVVLTPAENDPVGASSEENATGAQEEGAEAAEEGREGDERYVRMREKNRRAQQRFRQRQKAKLQAKELESFQLQKQVHEMQAQMATLQLQGAPADVKLQLAQLQVQNQALQLENTELRLLAARLIDENATLQASQMASTDSKGATSLAVGSAAQVSRTVNLLPRPHPFEDGSVIMGIPRMVAAPRSSVFSSLKRLPWERADQFLETGMPVGVSPGATGMPVLLKVLSKSELGSSTVMAKFPPGFIHDFILSTEEYIEEGLILAGSLTDTAFNQTYYPGDYAHVLPGTRHGPYQADCQEGALVLTFTRPRGPPVARRL